ncbi:MAG: solute carrier family 13 (sodium-dependent dicarboxylate transporter), er 2/3/5 [Clostridia bacterium]|nr:solute carrier family 13 (sodium-dependent dicarboxylate transporter), er 2/3/5 [Clostridia bacterium]
MSIGQTQKCTLPQETRQANRISILGFNKTLTEWLILFTGPVLYFLILALPIGDSITARGGLAIIAWTAWYWGTGAIPTGYCIFIPLLGTAFLPGMDWGKITQSLIHPGIGMILGPALIVCMWCRWGFTRRMALYCLKHVGTSVRAQAVTWLILATTTSFVAANVVIAIALTPIALEVLKNVGYDSGAKLKNSKSAMLIIIAVGVGASLGGFLTPMAGGQAVITWTQLCQTLGITVSMASFTSRMALPVFLSIIPVVILFGLVFPVDARHFEGSTAFFESELKKMGPISRAEVWGVVIFFLAILLPFLQPLWTPYLPQGVNVPPALIFSVVVGILALLPAPDAGAPVGKPMAYEKGERLLSINAFKVCPLQAFLIWPTAMSISILVNDTGASKLMANLLGSYWDKPAFIGVGLFVLFCVLLAQPASDTGAAGMLAPVVAAATVAAGQNPVPWLLMMGYTVNFSFCVPTATGTMALPIALEGKASWRLPVYGAVCAAVCGLVSWLFWGLVMQNNWTFWQTL